MTGAAWTVLEGRLKVKVSMVATIKQPEPLRHAPPSCHKRYVGEVVYMYAYDVAYEMSREPVASLLGQKLVSHEFDVSRKNPRRHMFYKPQMVRLPAVERMGPHGKVQVERCVKLLPVGAISITVRVPFAVDRLEELVPYHELKWQGGTLHDEVQALAESARQELQRYCIRPMQSLMDEEAYTVFCIEAPKLGAEQQPASGEAWLQQNRRQVASLLTQEDDVSQLSRQEAEESTSKFLSYYQNDLVVVDWDAALVVDERAEFDETLYVMELANLQLAELEAYDRLLDESLERSYRDLSQRRWRGRVHVLQELREIRIDLARFSDELMNITKFIGDWHLARVYEAISARFHLADWHRTLDEKLKTLDGLYEILKHDQNNRWMLSLEVTIVLLFIIDLIILFMGAK